MFYKSLEEKDVLIKAKSEHSRPSQEDLTNKVDENERLRQAVTSLKGRIFILETDICELEEGNEKTVEDNRKREAEMEAFQETSLKLLGCCERESWRAVR